MKVLFSLGVYNAELSSINEKHISSCCFFRNVGIIAVILLPTNFSFLNPHRVFISWLMSLILPKSNGSEESNITQTVQLAPNYFSISDQNALLIFMTSTVDLILSNSW